MSKMLTSRIPEPMQNVEETDSAGMRDEMTNGRTERVEAYGQGYQMIVLYCKIA